MAVYKIDGFDILPYIAEGGIKWSREDLDAKGSGRSNLTGLMHRSRVTTKTRSDVTFKDSMPLEAVRAVEKALYPEYVILETDLHPMYEEFIAEMYSNNVPVTTTYICDDGTVICEGFSAPLIER